MDDFRKIMYMKFPKHDIWKNIFKQAGIFVGEVVSTATWPGLLTP